MIGGADDTFARWLQGICGVPLFVVGLLAEFYDWTHLSSSTMWYGIGGLGLGSIYLGGRCLWYAITGRDNINRDGF